MSRMKPKFPKNNLKLKRHCSTKLFEEMCDLMFEIAKEDDDQYQSKAKYLNKHISKWMPTKNTKENSIKDKEDSKILRQKDISNCKEPAIQYRDCYRCALPLTPGHVQHCEGLAATCRYCGTQGHVKDACGKLGFFPEMNYSVSRKCRQSTDH